MTLKPIGIVMNVGKQCTAQTTMSDSLFCMLRIRMNGDWKSRK